MAAHGTITIEPPNSLRGETYNSSVVQSLKTYIEDLSSASLASASIKRENGSVVFAYKGDLTPAIVDYLEELKRGNAIVVVNNFKGIGKVQV